MEPRIAEAIKGMVWTVNHGNNTIEFGRNGKLLYYVDLDECTTSAQTLDWIFQVHGKAWCSPQCAHDLLTVMVQTLNPQGRLCSGGVERGSCK